ncbi:unnamed protein product [Symbiodinium sp. CCMP2456]|nr:unnamed protein product [Symbiodinium sp. CCMP2456]
MPTLFPEPVDLQGAEQPDGPLWERPSVLRAVFAAGQEQEDDFFAIVLFVFATTVLACGAALACFAYIRRQGAPGPDVTDQRGDVLLLADMEEGRAAAAVANVDERRPTGDAASPESEVDFDEVPDLDHVGYMLDIYQDRRNQRRKKQKVLKKEIKNEIKKARRAEANAQQVDLGGRAAVPRAPQLPQAPPLPQQTRQATAMMTFVTHAPSCASGTSSEVPPPPRDADGWETPETLSPINSCTQQVNLGSRAVVPRAPLLPRAPPLPRQTRQATTMMTFATHAPPCASGTSSEVTPPPGDVRSGCARVNLGGRAAVPRAPQLPRAPPLPRQTRQATTMMTFATHAPPCASGTSSEVPPPPRDADGWETWSGNFYEEALPDWALPEEEP